MKVSLKDLGKKLLKDQTDRTTIQLFRYLFVGGAAFIVDFGSLFILTDFFWCLLSNFSCNSIYFRVIGKLHFKCKLGF